MVSGAAGQPLPPGLIVDVPLNGFDDAFLEIPARLPI